MSNGDCIASGRSYWDLVRGLHAGDVCGTILPLLESSTSPVMRATLGRSLDGGKHAAPDWSDAILFRR